MYCIMLVCQGGRGRCSGGQQRRCAEHACHNKGHGAARQRTGSLLLLEARRSCVALCFGMVSYILPLGVTAKLIFVVVVVLLLFLLCLLLLVIPAALILLSITLLSCSGDSCRRRSCRAPCAYITIACGLCLAVLAVFAGF